MYYSHIVRTCLVRLDNYMKVRPFVAAVLSIYGRTIKLRKRMLNGDF